MGNQYYVKIVLFPFHFQEGTYDKIDKEDSIHRNYLISNTYLYRKYVYILQQ